MQEQEKKAPTDAEMSANWDKLLKEFHGLWEKSPKDLEKFELLKQKAKFVSMFSRQTQGIVDRCNNVINGTYGNTKKPEHYEQSKSSK
jgi:hypothetical protein